MELMDDISACILSSGDVKPTAPLESEKKKIETSERKIESTSDFFSKIKNEELQMQSDLLKENDKLINRINQSRGLVTQTTLDF